MLDSVLSALCLCGAVNMHMLSVQTCGMLGVCPGGVNISVMSLASSPTGSLLLLHYHHSVC